MSPAETDVDEQYLRCAIEHNGLEFHPGLEWRDEDDLTALGNQLENAVAMVCLLNPGMGYGKLAKAIKTKIREMWPGRAYFLEVGVESRWVQLFRPWGLPRVAKAPVESNQTTFFDNDWGREMKRCAPGRVMCMTCYKWAEGGHERDSSDWCDCGFTDANERAA